MSTSQSVDVRAESASSDAPTRYVPGPPARRLRGPDKQPRQVQFREMPTYPLEPDGRGFAVLHWLGKRAYLGVHGSPESHDRFSEVMNEWVAEYRRTQVAPPTIAELLFHYQEFAYQRYQKDGKPTSEVRVVKAVIADLLCGYGTLETNSFTPLNLLELRDLWKEKYVRDTVNGHMSRLRGIFKFGVSRMLVKAETLAALRTVESLRKHEGKQNKKVMPVYDRQINATLQHVTPPVAAMIQVQRLTGMRPEEVTSMHVAAIREAEVLEVGATVLVYSPFSHKTEHLDQCRNVVLGPKACEILAPWIDAAGGLASGKGGDDPTGYLFRPLSRWGGVAKNMKSHYSPDSYAKAITAACLKARVEPWGPNRLRHTAGTEIRKEFGVEVSRTVLGHSSMATTEIYAERDLRLAIEAMAKVG